MTPETKRVFVVLLSIMGLLVLCGLAAALLEQLVFIPKRKAEEQRKADEMNRKAIEIHARSRLIYDYAKTLKQDLVNVSTFTTRGFPGPGPRHPSVLRSPYPTEAEMEQVIGKADVRRESTIKSWQCSHIWRNYRPYTRTKTPTVKVLVLAWQHEPLYGARNATVMLRATLDEEGKLCELELGEEGDETIGKSAEMWEWENSAIDPE
jgi:hypothetical protein